MSNINNTNWMMRNRSLRSKVLRAESARAIDFCLTQGLDRLLIDVTLRNPGSIKISIFLKQLRRKYLFMAPTLPSDWYRLDLTKTKIENAVEIYVELSSPKLSIPRRISLLNAFVTIYDWKKERPKFNSYSELAAGDIILNSTEVECSTSTDDSITIFTTEELLLCLSASLGHQVTNVRAGSLRAIRYILRSVDDLQTFNDMQLTHLLCRSLDVLVEYEEERVQALKLVRKMLAISPKLVSPVIVRSLVALGDSGVEDNDRMLRACLATLCEFGVLNPVLLIVCGGVSVITRNVMECHSPRIAESLCGVLLHLLEWPQTRHIAGVRLDCLAAPYCDFTYRLGIMDKNKDARDLRFTCSRLALLSVLRSWTGTIEFCDPNRPSGLKAIVDVLYLNQLEVRKAILDLLYELLWLPQPVWTDEYSVALAAIDPAEYQDTWSLAEGFVAMEGRNVLPSLANCVPNICEIHTSLLLYCFLETGLLNALVEVVVSSDTFISVRATVLIGKLIQLMHTHLPSDIFNTSSALPALVTHAIQGNHQARAAINALHNLHEMHKNRPASCSLFLDLIIQSGGIINSKLFKRELKVSDTLTAALPQYETLERRRHDSVGSSTSSDEASNTSVLSFRRGGLNKSYIKQYLANLKEKLKQNERLLRDSNVLVNEDGKVWDWEIIINILKSDVLSKLDENHCRFIRRLIHYYKPSSNRFSHQDLGHGRLIPPVVMAGVELIDWLAKTADLQCVRMLTDLFSDINVQLHAISSKNPHECLFSPQHMTSTMSQQYFIFIGRMCRTTAGMRILVNTNIFKQLSKLVISTRFTCYIKLIVSGLDYSNDPMPREILGSALTAKRTASRLYATQFMLVLLRARMNNFEVWGLPMLVTQTRDSDRTVALTALEILDEACYERMYLEELVNSWYKFDNLGDSGTLLMIRYYSIPRGLLHPKAKLRQEIDLWVKSYCKRYVLLVEADTHAVLTLHTKSEDGTYSRRNCSSRRSTFLPNILPHLYGQLAQTSKGLTEIKEHGHVEKQIDILHQLKTDTENDCLVLKSVMWALAHLATSNDGLKYLDEERSRVIEKIIFLAKHCPVYSIRATSVHCLSLIGTTKHGADILFKYDWICVRHDRDTLWPICEPEDWMSKHMTPIRHQLDDMPLPYNYTGIDENLNGFFTANETTTPLFFEDPSCDKVDGSENNEINPQNPTRSNTLPDTVSRPFHLKHTRSLSESKTAEEFGSVGVNSRPRFNSGTDSNTSGVSSSDSVYGRYMVSDLLQTLSPIPSSSNLLEVHKSTNSRIRKISLTGASFRETTISPQDETGYAKLRSIRRNTRPLLSESAADELAEVIHGSKLSQQRKLKVRSLDRRSSFGYEEAPKRSPVRVPNKTDAKGPIYSGICLPKNILELFNHPPSSGTYVSQCVQEMEAIDVSANDGSDSSVSSLSDISSNSKRSKFVGKHNSNICLSCCRLKTSQRYDSDRNIHRPINTNNSPYNSTFISSDSVLAEDNMPYRITTNILRHVHRIANPVWSKQSKMALLELKQKHPASFQDICLYSEVCKAQSTNTYRLNSRRFLQELFFDLDFSCFFAEAGEIAERKAMAHATTAAAILDCDVVDGASCSNSNNISSSNNYNNSSSGSSSSSNSSGSSITSEQIYTLKTQLKSPPQLPSVTEASVEDLLQQGKASNSNHLVDCTETNDDGTKKPSNHNLRYSGTGRPRFNTLELDLSCTKNKFPITDRRKFDFSPTFTSNGIFDQCTVKKLSTSMSTPAGSLFCEKRISASKSEAAFDKPNVDRKDPISYTDLMKMKREQCPPCKSDK